MAKAKAAASTQGEAGPRTIDVTQMEARVEQYRTENGRVLVPIFTSAEGLSAGKGWVDMAELTRVLTASNDFTLRPGAVYHLGPGVMEFTAAKIRPERTAGLGVDSSRG
jgi:Xaa-Pro aminopeptidase